MSLATIRGQMILDVKQAIASYTAARLAHLQTVTALKTGGGALVAAGAGITAVGVGLLVALKSAADAAANFERRMDYVGAVTNATDAQMQQLRTSAIQLGQDTIYSAGQIADSFVELAKSGVATQDIIGGIGQAVANLGAAADIPLDSAANIIMSAVQTFQLSADQAVHVADLLAGAANASIVDVQDLGVSLKYVGGVASALGIPLESVNDALALLGTYGIKGSTAGTSLRQIMVSLTGSTKKATQELTDLGIITADGSNKFFDAQGNAKSLSEIFQILQDATAGMSSEQQVAAYRTIFQNRALAAALDLTKAGAAGFASMNEEINKTTAMEVAGKRLDNLSGDIEILKGNIETLVITQGSSLQEFFRGIVQGATDALQWFTNLSDGTQAFIIKAVAISGVVLTVVGALGMISGAILNLMAVGTQLGNALTLIKGLTTAVTVAQWAQNAAFLASPITWIILAVMALVAAFIYLWNNNEGFRNFFIKTWDTIKNAFSAVVDWFKGIPAWWDNLWSSIKETTTSIWNAIIDFIKGIPQFLLDLFMKWTIYGIIISHWDEILAGTKMVWNAVVDFIKAIPGNIVSFFQELPGRIGYIIGFMVGTVLRLMVEMGVNIWNAVTNAWESLIGFFQALPGRVEAFVLDLYNRVVNWMMNMGLQAYNAVLALRDSVVNFFQELPGRVESFVIDLYNRVVNWFINMGTQVRQKVIDLYNGVTDWFSKLPSRLAALASDIYNGIVDKFTQAKDKAVEIATNIFNQVSDAITGLPDLVKGIFDKVLDAIKSQVTKAFNAVKDFANGLWEGFKDGLGIHSPSYIERAMWQITGVLDEETQRMKGQVGGLQRLGNGMVEMGNSIGKGFNNGMDASINNMQAQLAQAQAYHAKLASLAGSSTISLSTPGSSGVAAINNQSPIVVKAGDQITVDVTWHAAPNDQITTRDQVKNLLGSVSSVLSTEESK